MSRPSLREALRILEAEGLITVVRGVQGGVVVHRPDQRLTARTAALVLQARNVVAGRRVRGPDDHRAGRRAAGGRRPRPARSARRLRALIAEEEAAIDDPVAFGRANARFHEELVAMAGNQTLTIVAEMLNEVVARAVTAVSQADAGERVDRHPPARASGRRSAWPRWSRPATPRRPRSTGAPTWRSSAA